MDNKGRRVVISGLGLITPLGIGPEANASALIAGRGAVDRIRAFPVEGLACDAAGEVHGFDPKAHALPAHKKVLQKSLKYMARDIQLAVAGAEIAIADARLADGGVDPTRIGVDLGAGLISSELDELAEAINESFATGGEFHEREFGHAAMKHIQPIWLLKYLPNMLACHISILSNCQGPSNSITEGDCAAILAIGEALRIIARNQADMMITGGADSKIHPMSLVRWSLLEQISRWEGAPSAACRPFDARRAGTVPGEGAGLLIIEEIGHARARGAKIYGEILGFGSGCDAHKGGGIDPEGKGAEIAIRAALRDAGLEPDQIGHVHAHGAGLVGMDLAEGRAIERVFGPRGVPVVAIKGYMGNLASGAGSVELLESLACLAQERLPVVLNCDDPDPKLHLDLIRGEPRAVSNPVFLKLNVTRHGQAAALVVRAGGDA
jgi:3-oxoacyl-[acyl-carrier-protein] synthase II